MALIVANTYQLTLNGSNGANVRFANVFHFEKLGLDPPTILEATQVFYDAYADAFASYIMDEYTFDSVSYVDLSSSTGDSGTTTPTGAHHGTGTGNAAPPQVSLLITWQATGGRSQRNGRSYLPGIDEGSIDTVGQVSGGYADGATVAANDFLETMDAAGLSGVVVSRTSPSTGTARTITGGLCQRQVATQRRRNRR